MPCCGRQKKSEREWKGYMCKGCSFHFFCSFRRPPTLLSSSCFDCGMNDFLAKPINIAQLDECLRKWGHVLSASLAADGSHSDAAEAGTTGDAAGAAAAGPERNGAQGCTPKPAK